MVNHHLCTEVTPQCPVEATTYGYYPSLPASYIFIIIFGLACLSQIALGFRYKTYPYMIVAVIGMFGETVGYVGRLLMHGNPWSGTGFKIQICCLVLAPSFLAACIYLSLKHIVRYCGPQYSRVKPRLYTWYFIGGDFSSIVVQAIGGGVAAAGTDNASVANVGDRIIITGIALQLVVMSFAAAFIAEFAWRIKKQRPIVPKTKAHSGSSSPQPGQSDQEKAVAENEQQAVAQTSAGPGMDKKFKRYCIGMGIAFLAIYIRCVYRIPEMSGGWGGPLMRKETDFYVLDGMMCAIACIMFTVFHPAFFFPVMRRGFEW